MVRVWGRQIAWGWRWDGGRGVGYLPRKILILEGALDWKKCWGRVGGCPSRFLNPIHSALVSGEDRI